MGVHRTLNKVQPGEVLLLLVLVFFLIKYFGRDEQNRNQKAKQTTGFHFTFVCLHVHVCCCKWHGSSLTKDTKFYLARSYVLVEKKFTGLADCYTRWMVYIICVSFANNWVDLNSYGDNTNVELLAGKKR